MPFAILLTKSSDALDATLFPFFLLHTEPKTIRRRERAREKEGRERGGSLYVKSVTILEHVIPT